MPTAVPELTPLPLGSLRPAGWLAAQLQRQADGMAGHLDEFWPDVRDSAWIGGTAEGWERGPYWLDGVTPLAFVLDDEKLKAKVAAWVDYIVDHQREDGWIGPESGDPNPAHHDAFGVLDVWPRMIALKALLQYRAATGDERVTVACLRLARRIGTVLREHPLHEWGRVRWADLVLSLQELHRLTGDASLLEVAELAHQQGYDWESYAASLPYRERVSLAKLKEYQADSSGIWMNDDFLATHGANVAMGIKALPVRWAMSGDPELRALFLRVLRELDEYHGQATGLFASDEHLAGRHPSQGTETCTLVEYMFSLEIALEAWGVEEAIVDRLERIAFNALPASARADEWAHQYDQQANQVVVQVVSDPIYTNNPPDSNVFALEPCFGCCTANRHQGWPKFAARLWMRGADESLTALSYAPCTIDTTVRGVPVRIDVNSDYPFRDSAEILVAAQRAVEAELHLRIPGWAIDPTVEIDGEVESVLPGTIHTVRRLWERDRIVLTWSADLQVEERFEGAIAVRRGPIVFSSAIAEEWRMVGGELPHATWEVHPGSPWSRGVFRAVDGCLVGELEARPVGAAPFTPEGAPLRIRAAGFEIPSWTFVRGAADAPPSSPVGETGRGDLTEVELLPYGAARLRVTEIPWATRE